ncbi:MAG: hypothetical protein PHY73_00625 [Candidatus Omnitrophica bacterium]|nr:hypothetical protein [Candidatus Omnitrophota bacterium]
MVKRRKNKSAQFLGEYTIVIAIATFAIIGMTLFVQRGLSARINDARGYAVSTLDPDIKEVHIQRGGKLYPQVLAEYEPYYAQKDTTTASNASADVLFDGASDQYVHTVSSNIQVQATSVEGFARDDDYNN